MSLATVFCNFGKLQHNVDEYFVKVQ